jgi:hypothetical protein
VPALIIHGVTNTTDYDTLCAASSIEALEAAEALVMELFRLVGFSTEELNNALVVWIGKREATHPVEKAGHAVPAWLLPHVER